MNRVRADLNDALAADIIRAEGHISKPAEFQSGGGREKLSIGEFCGTTTSEYLFL